jgi:hypothetical protein
MLGCSGLNGSQAAPHQTTGVVVTSQTLDFGTVQVGTTAVRSNTIINNTGSAIVLTGAQINKTDFKITGQKLPVKLAPGEQAALQVAYTPQSLGQSQGTVVLASNMKKLSPTFVLKGTGTATTGVATAGPVRLTPASISFGAVPLGQTTTQSATLSNFGTRAVTVTKTAISGQGFALTGLSLPLTLGARQSVTFGVNFTPAASGMNSAMISLISTVSLASQNRGNRPGQTAPGQVALNTVSSTLNLPVSGTGTTASTSTTTTPGQLAVSPPSLALGSVRIGTIQTRSVTLTNHGGTGVTLRQASITGSGFAMSGLTFPTTLATGQSKTFVVIFAPRTTGSAAGNIAVMSDATNSVVSVPISALAQTNVGTGTSLGVLSSSDASLSFGNVPLGNSATQSETLINSGSSSVTISQASVSGNSFRVTGLSLPMTLSPGQSFTFGVAFAPTTGGIATGSVAVASDASNATLTISLAGAATVAGQLTVSPATLNFGSVIAGQSKSLTGKLTASGSSITVTNASMTSSEFTVSGLSLPVTLAAGQSASFTVNFTPQASGTAAATASFISNASNPSAIESLTGGGTGAPQHSVTLSWNPSTSSVVGYNLYRGTTSGGPYSQINAMNASTSYVDSSVQAGQTYFYVTTAVDGANRESGYSNQAQAVVPSP